uniref:Uncharacterized protein n=1 Tax=Anguilla anguilla TaxID=7936 RepID=A0A0E9TUX1_ANGAN
MQCGSVQFLCVRKVSKRIFFFARFVN